MTVTGIDSYVRGESVEFDFTFTDKDGNAAVPDSATVHVRYFAGNVRTVAQIALQLSSGVWSGSWDSSVADAPSRIDWHVRTAGSTKAAEQGRFSLQANDANPDPS